MITDVLNNQIQVSQYILDKHTGDISQEESLRSPETGGSSLNWLAGHILASRNSMLKLLEAAQQTQNPNARDSLYAEMSRIMESYLPLTLLAPQVVWFVAINRIKGLSSPFRASPLWHIEHAWVEEP